MLSILCDELIYSSSWFFPSLFQVFSLSLSVSLSVFLWSVSRCLSFVCRPLRVFIHLSISFCLPVTFLQRYYYSAISNISSTLLLQCYFKHFFNVIITVLFQTFLQRYYYSAISNISSTLLLQCYFKHFFNVIITVLFQTFL